MPSEEDSFKTRYVFDKAQSLKHLGSKAVVNKTKKLQVSKMLMSHLLAPHTQKKKGGGGRKKEWDKNSPKTPSF